MDLYIYYLYNNKIQFDCNLDNFRLELKARDEISDTDSECENDDYVKNTLITTYQTGLNNEHDQTSSSTITNTTEDIFTEQQKLKEEAKIALVLGAKMARMQVEFEREAFERKRSSFYDLIGINVNVDKPLTIENLEEMNIGQLQAIINDLYCLIEENNDELIHLLIERDSLSMKQDSILVDIEDLQKRLQERAVNLSKESLLNDPIEYVYIVKRPQKDVPKRSIFQNLLRKAMFI